ncbi:unnamed protein product [Ilex paraguariensis]|uniref:Uncharacterized protein n=1 Tax=Ilex paraguariensis TaxID=185542 RepID=A0ABC8SSI1_9AQUA
MLEDCLSDSWDCSLLQQVSSVPQNDHLLLKEKCFFVLGYLSILGWVNLTEMNTSPSQESGPVIVYLPSHPTREEWSNIIGASKRGVALTGSAAMGQIGPVLGLIDIGECEDSYLFRVSLPGVKRDESMFYFGI